MAALIETKDPLWVGWSGSIGAQES